jgi:hypothetical protein
MSKVWFVTEAGSENRCRRITLMKTCPSRRMASSDKDAELCDLNSYDSASLPGKASNH